MRFITSLTLTELKKLTEIKKHPLSYREGQRAQMLLLSHEGYSIEQLMSIYQVSRDTISRCFDRWENEGLAGLVDKARSGRPTRLTLDEQKLVLEMLQDEPRSMKIVQQQLVEQTNKQVSEWTLKRIAKRGKLRWKRMRKTVAKPPNQAHQAAAAVELAELEQQAQTGTLAVVYVDESGFSLTPVVPYAWQPIGQTLTIPSAHSPRLNVFGLLSTTGSFTSYVCSGNINSEVVINCIDHYLQTITQTTVLVFDQAPWHTSQAFLAKVPPWRRAGLVIKYLPAYSPHLNKIERLWRHIKYYWLPLSAYTSPKNFSVCLLDTLANIGTKFRFSFA